MSKQRFKSVWDAIEDTPGDAANMKACAELMRAIAENIRSSGMTQAEAAKTLGVTQPRIADLMRSKVDVFAGQHAGGGGDQAGDAAEESCVTGSSAR